MTKPSWEQYEEFIAKILERVCAALGITSNPLEVVHKTTVWGVTSPHQVDVIAYGSRDVVFVECKNHARSIGNDQTAPSIASLFDLAPRFRDRRLSWIIASSSPVTPGGVRSAQRLASHLPSEDPVTLHLLCIPATGELPHVYVLDQAGDRTTPTIVPLADEGLDLETALARCGEAPDLGSRLTASGIILASSRVPKAVQLTAAVENATCHLHLGHLPLASMMAKYAGDLARELDDTFPMQSAKLVHLNARLGSWARAGKTRPAESAISRLKKQLPQMLGSHRTGAAILVGSWIGRTTDAEEGRRLLQEAARAADVDPNPPERYHSFLARTRLGELETGQEQLGLLDQAAGLLPELEPRHRGLASTLLTHVTQEPADSLVVVFGSQD